MAWEFGILEPENTSPGSSDLNGIGSRILGPDPLHCFRQ